jgi:hypothetical protein
MDNNFNNFDINQGGRLQLTSSGVNKFAHIDNINTEDTIRLSIEKWAIIVDHLENKRRLTGGIHSETCALCWKFYDSGARFVSCCNSCPLYIYKREWECCNHKSPWYKFNLSHFEIWHMGFIDYTKEKDEDPLTLAIKMLNALQETLNWWIKLKKQESPNTAKGGIKCTR